MGTSNINHIFFSNAGISTLKKITLLVCREGVPVTIVMYCYVSTCFLSVVISMSEQMVPSAVMQYPSLNF
jgi:hypothetical protein